MLIVTYQVSNSIFYPKMFLKQIANVYPLATTIITRAEVQNIATKHSWCRHLGTGLKANENKQYHAG